MRLKGQVAIITGAASGIGLAACERFLEEGAKVVLADFNEQEGMKQTEKLRAKGYDPYFISVDVANKKSVDRLIKETTLQYGKIDILINNAGITDDATLQDRKSTRLNSSHVSISYAVFCLKKKKTKCTGNTLHDNTHIERDDRAEE